LLLWRFDVFFQVRPPTVVPKVWEIPVLTGVFPFEAT
jgi:hypothetical protein